MKIKSIYLKNFKRFSDLRIEDISETTKLVLLAGPNGCGKSSLFEGIYVWHRTAWKGTGNVWDADYHQKRASKEAISWNQATQVQFHGDDPVELIDRQKAVYVRSAYRNDPQFQIGALQKVQTALQEERFSRLIENDATVNRNYQRLASQGIEDVYEKEDPSTTIGAFREKTIGEVKNSMLRLFPDLKLNGLGNPLTEGTFRFDKGDSKGFRYMNLSGGEKAAFDLVLDIIVKKREYDDTVFCIDEPEAHMNARLQGALLQELYDLLPDKSQLWIATHSIGMMRKARDIGRANPGSVVFLDFGDIDFDQPQTLSPVKTNRVFWDRILSVALDDLSELVAPEQIIVCEGAPLIPGSGANAGMDARCYNMIFEDELPETKFISAGSANEVEKDKTALVAAIEALVRGARVYRLIDRDDLSPDQVAEKRQEGVRVLSQRNLESYLFDDEVLTALCVSEGQPDEAANLIEDKARAMTDAQSRGGASDDVKRAAGGIYVAAKKRLQLTAVGNDAKAFMRDTLAPLVTRDMAVYAKLKADIFSG